MKDEKVVAVVLAQKLMDYLINKNLSKDETVYKVWHKEFSAVNWDDADAAAIQQLLIRRNFVFVVKKVEPLENSNDSGSLEVYYAT